MVNLLKQFEHEDRVLMRMKLSMPRLADIPHNDVQGLRNYISLMETMLNSRTLIHYQCRKIARVLLSNYNNSRADLATIIQQIINNE